MLTSSHYDCALLLQYMVSCSDDANEDVASEACEFWTVFTEQRNSTQFLRPYLPALIPILLKHMRYSIEDQILLKVRV